MGLNYTFPDAPWSWSEGRIGTTVKLRLMLGLHRPGYRLGGPVQVLSDDGMAITWAIPKPPTELDLNDTARRLLSEGIMADASAVGNGEDITATVMVSGVEATGSPVKLADVTTGLDIEVTAATGLQCEAGSATATIMFTEGFNSAITAVRGVARSRRSGPTSG